MRQEFLVTWNDDGSCRLWQEGIEVFKPHLQCWLEHLQAGVTAAIDTASLDTEDEEAPELFVAHDEQGGSLTTGE